MSDQREQLNEMKKFRQLMEDADSSEGRPYIVLHSKKDKFECHANSSYEAAVKAAKHWGMKSTAGISPHLADITHSTQFVGEDEGHSIRDILDGAELSDLLSDLDKEGDIVYGASYFDKLYFHFLDTHPDEIPVGSRTGRPDDVDSYVLDNLENDYGDEVRAMIDRDLDNRKNGLVEDDDECDECGESPDWCECSENEEEEAHYDLKDAEVEKFKGRKIIITDLWDGNAYGILDSKSGPRFMLSGPMDRGYGVGEVSDDEIEVHGPNFDLSPKDEAFLRDYYLNSEDELEEANFYDIMKTNRGDEDDEPFVPRDRHAEPPHTPGYDKQSSSGRAAADSRAQAFKFDEGEGEGQELGSWGNCPRCEGHGTHLGIECWKCEGTGNEPGEELDEDYGLASMAFDIVAGGFIGWAAVTAWPKVKGYLESRKYGNILADFEKNVSPESIKAYADKLEAKLVSTHPSSKKALAGRLKSIEAKLQGVGDAENYHGIQRQISLLRSEMARAEKFVKKSNSGHSKRKSKRKAVGEDFPAQGSEQECAWWAGCNNEATTTESHPVLGDVPICDRCADKLRKIDGLDEGTNDNWGVGDFVVAVWDEAGRHGEPLKVIGVKGDEVVVVDDYGNKTTMFPEDLRLAPSNESISLGSIVESVLEEYPGQPKDYAIADDELEAEQESEFEKDYIDSEIEDEELGLRFD